MQVAGRNTSGWKRLRMQCFRRDRAADAPCGICKGARGPIDYAAKPSSTDLSWEPDHKLPVKTHPELAEVPENIQASHRVCNRAKSGKAGISNIGAPSRKW